MPMPNDLGQNVDFASYVLCRYNVERQQHGYATSVDMTVTVGRSMDGWEMYLQFSTTANVKVKSVRGGQLIGSEISKNGSVVVRNLVPRLKAFDSFRVAFTVRHGQSNVKLFPATFLLKQPPRRQANGMCGGSSIRPSMSDFVTLKNSKYKMTLTFSSRHTRWMSCQLVFDVPIRIILVQRAEF